MVNRKIAPVLLVAASVVVLQLLLGTLLLPSCEGSIINN
jgi:hypothetical protein